MGIRVECPHGHTFKVKDKYAGKRGLCPHCKGQVVVKVPQLTTSTTATEETYRKVVIDENRAKHAVAPPTGDSSVLDDEHAAMDSSTSGSLLGSSVIKHNSKCKCGTSVPMWFAKCPGCGEFMERR